MFTNLFDGSEACVSRKIEIDYDKLVSLVTTYFIPIFDEHRKCFRSIGTELSSHLEFRFEKNVKVVQTERVTITNQYAFIAFTLRRWR